MSPYGLFFVLLNLLLDVGGSTSQSKVKRHLDLGRDFLARGQLSDALTQYHAAVDGEPNNYLTYFKRGIVHFALERPKSALTDFNKALELKPDFVGAQVQKGYVMLKQGLFEEARKSFSEVLSAEPHHEEALNGIDLISPTLDAIHQAKYLMAHGQYEEVIDYISRVIDVCPWNAELRELRAESHEANGDIMNAVADYHSVTKLRTDDTKGYYKLAIRLYHLGHVDKALTEIRSCLRLDPEHKECFPFYKKIKEIAKLISKAEDSEDAKTRITSAKKILKLEPTEANVQFHSHLHLCRSYPKDNEFELGIEHCQKALKHQRDADLLCDSAEAYLAGDMFDEAIREINEALKIDAHNERANKLHKHAQQQQKISSSRDYYKILNVPRTATKREITKAYRKAAQKWHPDNFPEEDKKKVAEKKFHDIAAAKEVLTDDEKRQKFDQGIDPLDPEYGKHQHPFNPFQEHNSHFHGSPFQFKFHFN